MSIREGKIYKLKKTSELNAFAEKMGIMGASLIKSEFPKFETSPKFQCLKVLNAIFQNQNKVAGLCGHDSLTLNLEVPYLQWHKYGFRWD